MIASIHVCPVAQLVEHWFPGGESPGSSRSGARYMSLLMEMVCDWQEQPQPVDVSRVGRSGSGFDGHDTLGLLNSPETRNCLIGR